MPNWFYKKDGQVIGPVSKQELEFLASEGRVKASTMVRSGSAEDWKRFRSAISSTPISKSIDSVSLQPNVAATAEDSAPKNIARNGPPELTSESDLTRRQAIIGAVCVVIVLLLVWFFWSQSAGSSLNGTRDLVAASVANDNALRGPGTGAARAVEQDQQTAGQADDESSAVVDAGADQSQSGKPAENSGVGQVETESAGQAAQDDAQSTASVASDNDSTSDDDLATEAMDGQESVQAGDPMSKFTISAPGEAVFFGLRATGNRFAFVVDRSGSMNGVRMERAREELMNCIDAMPKHVEVFVVFFSSIAEPDKALYRKVDSSNLKQLRKWVDSMTAAGGTEVSAGMQEVFSQPLLPDSIFLLTDGDFDPSTPLLVRQLNASGSVRINTVALVSRSGERSLKQIAKQNGGDYKYVP